MAGPARQIFLNAPQALRRDFTVATALQTDGNGNYVEMAFQIPAGSIHTSTQLITTTVFNAGTANTVSVGSVGGTATNMMAATNVTAVGVQTIAGSGRVSTTADTTVRVYLIASGTAPTTGDVSVLVHYYPQSS